MTAQRNKGVLLKAVLEALEPRRLLSTVYVDANAAAGGTHDGTSWPTAYLDLQQALTGAASGTEIRVANGTYKPTSGMSRTVSFAMKNGVGLYGGYAGNGAADPNARDISAYPTILSGDIGAAGTKSDNSYHVVTADAVNATSILDGFTIAAGYANGSGALRKGAGIYNTGASPTVANCIFIANTAISASNDRAQGGGMYNSYSSPTLSNCVFRDNVLGRLTGGLASEGGGMFNTYSSPSLTHCTFTDNSADWGGAIHSYINCYPTFTDCTFSSNAAVTGGVMYNSPYCSTTLTRCTFSGNSAEASSGAIYNGESGGTWTDCTFEGNSALTGGVIENRDRGSSPTLIRCNFSGNSATNWAGAIWNVLGASPTLTDCTFTGNSTLNDGGAMYNDGYAAPTLTNCKFTGNSAKDGGGIYNGNYAAPTLTNCTFEQNTATNYGGAVSGGASFTGCTFTRNSAGADGGAALLGSFTGCGFYGNSAGGNGGGLWTTSPVAPATLANCIFVGNSTGGDGGGMYLHTYQYSDPAPVTNCTFAANSAGRGGGAIHSWNDSLHRAELANCILWGNTGPTAGDQIHTYGGFSVSYSDIQGGGWFGNGNLDSDPQFVRTPSPGTDNTWGTADDDYGDLRISPVSPVVDAGSDIAVPAGVTTDFSGAPRFRDITSIPDTGQGTAPVVDMGAYEAVPSLAADAEGPYFVVEGGQVVLHGRGASDAAGALQYEWEWDGDGLFDDAVGSDPVCATGALSAGTVRQVQLRITDAASESVVSAATTIEIVNVITYVDARATAGTGSGASWSNAYLGLAQALEHTASGQTIRVSQGIYNPTSGTDRTVSLSLTSGVELYGGYAGYGAAVPNARDVAAYPSILSGDIGTTGLATDNSYHVITAIGVNSTALLDGFTITSGYADGLGTASCGAGFYNLAGSPRLVDCSFVGNTATGPGFSMGGGMYNEQSAPTLIRCSFIGNSATDGGGMSNRTSSPVLTNCIFSDNSAGSGGGMANGNGSCPTLDHCDFVDNTAPWGGAVNNDNSSPAFANCTFSGNSSGSEGGALCEWSSSSTLTSCSFTGNSATEYGGAIFGGSVSSTLTNCVFIGNSAGYGGGVVLHTYSDRTPTIANCTFSGNAAATAAGGILINSNGGTAIVVNCILWGNTAETGVQIADYNGGLAITYSDIQGGWAGTGNIDVDPLFVRNPSTGDFGDLRLQANSPCIDAGSNPAVSNGVTLDMAGVPRFADVPGMHDPGVVVDMGAYERPVSFAAAGGEFLFDAAQPTLAIGLNSNLLPQSLSAGDLVLLNLTTGQVIDLSALALASYDAATFSARWVLPAPLPDGNYRATLPAGSLSDACGAAICGDISFDFFCLAGDANRDRMVDITDLGLLAMNWQGADQAFSQGDFNYDGVVDITDLGILATNWQKSVLVPSALAAGSVFGRDVSALTRPVLSFGPPARGNSRHSLVETVELAAVLQDCVDQ